MIQSSIMEKTLELRRLILCQADNFCNLLLLVWDLHGVKPIVTAKVYSQ